MAFNLLSNYATDATIKAYVDKYDFYIFPVVNPDGKWNLNTLSSLMLTYSRLRLYPDNRASVA